jgi:hypothetical protein
MFRLLLTLGSVLLAAVPAAATNYSATLAKPATGLLVARDIAWTCSATGCEGSTENSRPAVLCQSLAKRAGWIDSFTVDGRPIAAADLARCNATAKAAPQSAVAER